MICKHCKTEIKVTNTYTLDAAKTQRAECPKCHCVYTCITLIVCEALEQGQGAKALAERLKRTDEQPEVRF